MKDKSKKSNRQADLLSELDGIKSRVVDYDWEYRLSRFEEKLKSEMEEASKVVIEMKSTK
ncbi:MAG: hypothetical protein RR470_01165 [Vagococcus sp.]|uniref:hypothetical protein n=1 Tax=Vagococcus sp. TaxID=1933889 RepID=UPI002FC68E0B